LPLAFYGDSHRVVLITSQNTPAAVCGVTTKGVNTVCLLPVTVTVAFPTVLSALGAPLGSGLRQCHWQGVTHCQGGLAASKLSRVF